MYSKKSWRTPSALLCCSLFLPLSASKAEHITGVSIHDFSSELSSFNSYAQYLIDGSGLTGNVHTTDGWGTMWLNTGNGYFGGTPGPDPTNPSGVGATITFDLGAEYDLSTMRVWNHNNIPRPGDLGLLNRGARSVSVYSAPDLSSAFQHVADYEFLKATGVGYTGDVYDLDVSGARLVKFHIKSNFQGLSDARLVGLSEVQFFGAANVPEPSSLMLLSAAAAVMILRRGSRNSVATHGC